MFQNNMPFPKKKKLFVQSHSVNLCTKDSVLFFAENWYLEAEAVFEFENFILQIISLLFVFDEKKSNLNNCSYKKFMSLQSFDKLN